MLRIPRPEAELYWYAKVGNAACSGGILPIPPPQQPALFRADGGFIVSRSGAVRALADGRVLLDPTALGACHRMLPADSSDATTAPAPPAASSYEYDHDELFVISQVPPPAR